MFCCITETMKSFTIQQILFSFADLWKYLQYNPKWLQKTSRWIIMKLCCKRTNWKKKFSMKCVQESVADMQLLKVEGSLKLSPLPYLNAALPECLPNFWWRSIAFWENSIRFCEVVLYKCCFIRFCEVVLRLKM